MSKMDELRALREARYERTLAGAAAKTQGAPAKAKRAVPEPAAVKRTPVKGTPGKIPPVVPDAGLCGHRAISGRTCTREHGHTAKSHRYS